MVEQSQVISKVIVNKKNNANVRANMQNLEICMYIYKRYVISAVCYYKIIECCHPSVIRESVKL